MIADTIANRGTYEFISPLIRAALDHLAATDFSNTEPCRYELDGDNLFVLVQKYSSVPRVQGKWECHRKYIDVQFIAEGVEQIGYNSIENMGVLLAYNQEKDIAILQGEGDYITLRKNAYGIFFPQDAHQPKVAPDDIPGQVTKVVVKVMIE